MHAVYRLEQSLFAKGPQVAASDAVFYGTLTMLAHLTLLLVNRLLISQDINAHIPASLLPETNFWFYFNVAVGLLFELMIFFIGWLFIGGLAVLFDGRANARPLFGWLGLCYLPKVLFSAGSFIWLLLGLEGVDYAALERASTGEQLARALEYTRATGAYRVLSNGDNLAYLLVLVLVIETIHRVCGLSRFKAALIPGLYVGLLFALNNFAG